MSQEKLIAILRARWHGMIGRCTRKNHASFQYYGARGIRVCDEWLDFRAFVIWALQNGFKVELSLERENNDGDYGPSNCKWVNQSTQMQNTRRTGSYAKLDEIISR